jgi:8-oxo-dGTP pyrophosphatase MutT (NUDIX family)/predicted ATPase
MKNAERKAIISALQEQAKDVLELKKSSRPKRPIVIEFSGSPKSGKTSCINSLELFLKRNGFRVMIVQERASICPVSNKESPMFNIWTACMTITGMLGVLEKKDVICDVLILDRGIFDAFCWFEWLASKKMMEHSQKKIIEAFFSMDSLANPIDIVFAFTAAPIDSINREYARLLTDKPGTIMNKRALSEYLEAMRCMIESKDKHFHNIIEINTSEKGQDEVGKEVTEKTLSTLKSTLMERIGYVTPAISKLETLEENTTFENIDVAKFFGKISFDSREIVENTNSWLQPVPIAVITDHKRERVLTVKKRTNTVSSDSPERDKLLLYVGGHSRAEDSTDINSDDFLSICRYTLRREVKEELGISVALNEVSPFIIYTPNAPKSKKHIAICFLLELDIDQIKLDVDATELMLHKGKSKSGQFQNVKEFLHREGSEMESWSVEIAKHCFGIDCGGQITFFHYETN